MKSFKVHELKSKSSATFENAWPRRRIGVDVLVIFAFPSFFSSFCADAPVIVRKNRYGGNKSLAPNYNDKRDDG